MVHTYACGYCQTIITKTDEDEATSEGCGLEHDCTHQPHSNYTVSINGARARHFCEWVTVPPSARR